MALGVLALAAGCLGASEEAGSGDPTSAPEDTDQRPASPVATDTGSPASSDGDPEPRVTVAVVDDSANLYHEAFRADESWTAPAPGGATPIELSLEAPDRETALERDWATISNLEPRTMYTVPGTRFVGAISFLDPVGCVTQAEQECFEYEDPALLLDDPANGTTHGAYSTARLAGTGTSLAGDEPSIGIVLVQVRFNTTSIVEGITWASEQPWIDAMSLSVGSLHGRGSQAFLEALDTASERKPVFKAAGNGAPGSYFGPGYVGRPTWAWEGTPDEITVGGVDNDHLTQWSDTDPYVAADACGFSLPQPGTMDGTTTPLEGTSWSAPYAAGAGARLILEARERLGDLHVGVREDTSLSPPEDGWSSGRAEDAHVVLAEGDPGGLEDGPLADGTFTLRELKDVLYHTAQPTPTAGPHDGQRCDLDALPAEQVPEQARFASIGYGEIDVRSLDAGLAVLGGEAELPARETADVHYERVYATRSTTMAEEPGTPDLVR